MSTLIKFYSNWINLTKGLYHQTSFACLACPTHISTMLWSDFPKLLYKPTEMLAAGAIILVIFGMLAVFVIALF